LRELVGTLLAQRGIFRDEPIDRARQGHPLRQGQPSLLFMQERLTRARGLTQLDEAAILFPEQEKTDPEGDSEKREEKMDHSDNFLSAMR